MKCKYEFLYLSMSSVLFVVLIYFLILLSTSIYIFLQNLIFIFKWQEELDSLDKYENYREKSIQLNEEKKQNLYMRCYIHICMYIHHW